jgi:hypothetical protein
MSATFKNAVDPPLRAPEKESPGDGESTRTKPLAGSERAFANHIAASRAAASAEGGV